MFGYNPTLHRIFLSLLAIIKFLHCLLLILAFFSYLRDQRGRLGDLLPDLYQAFTAITFVAYFAIVSPLYGWSWRYPIPLESAMHRLKLAGFLSFLLADLPISCVEIAIVWKVGLANDIQATSFFFGLVCGVISLLLCWMCIVTVIMNAYATLDGSKDRGARADVYKPGYPTTQPPLSTFPPPPPPGVGGVAVLNDREYEPSGLSSSTGSSGTTASAPSTCSSDISATPRR